MQSPRPVRWLWSPGEKCAAHGVSDWSYWCKEAQGCVWGFAHNGDVIGFFGVFIHGCVQPQEVKVKLFGSVGAPLGTAPGYTGLRAAQRAPSRAAARTRQAII